MCGITGIIKFDGNVINEDELKTFNNSLHHRGPDSKGIYLNNNKSLGLGHTRTSIFDISAAGHQPMSYLNERYWITYNGEIYNFIELRNELLALGYIFKSDCDTEVILAAYSEWGEQCQFKFNGDWAFAIWDNKEKNLFISCDRFGTKPLYYIHHRKYFIFASELKSFMFLQGNLIPDFNYGFLLWLGKNNGSLNTFLKDVFSLAGGHQIYINQNNIFKLKKWWSTIDHLVEVPKNYGDQVAHFKKLFFDACKIRLRSDVPIASCLSGGVDSSSIVSTIAKIKEDSHTIERQATGKQNVFICDFVDDQKSEKHFAKDVINNKDINATYLDIDISSITPEDLIKVQFNNENIDVDSLQLSLLYKKMKEKGIRVSIDGNTPDETLGGFFNDPPIAMRDAIWPWSEKGRFEDLESIWKSIRVENNYNIKNKIIEEMIKIDKIKNLTKSSIKSLILSTPIKKYFSNKIVEIWKQEKIESKEENKYDLIEKPRLIYPKEDKINQLDFFNAHLYRQFHYYATPMFLNKTDKNSMAHGVESRAPFIDVNLITYLFSLPSKAKIGGGYTKRILRDSMKNLVPNSVLNCKNKRGFNAPDTWYQKVMKHHMLDSMNSVNFLESNIFNGKKIKEDYENKKYQNDKNTSKVVLRYIHVMTLINSFNQIKKNN